MNHMSLPDDNYETLLRDYASDTADNGFSDLVMSKIDKQATRQANTKKICVYGAIFIGGLIAGKQSLALLDIWQNAALSSAASSIPLVPIIAAIALPFTLWLIEQQEFAL